MWNIFKVSNEKIHAEKYQSEFSPTKKLKK